MFKLVVVLLAALVCVLGAAVPEDVQRKSDSRIVGGATTNIESFPWQASILRQDAFVCGGAIYNKMFIITAAHCLQDTTVYLLRVGIGSNKWSGGAIYSVAAFKTHENYNPVTMANDIAVVRVSRSISFYSATQPIPLASSSPVNGAAAVVSGWGATASGYGSVVDDLQAIDVKIISQIDCASSKYGYGSRISSSMICAAASGKDTCQGDAGSPLVSNNYLVGISSWGIGCAVSRYPGVYTDVVKFRSWILDAVIKT